MSVGLKSPHIQEFIEQGFRPTALRVRRGGSPALTGSPAGRGCCAFSSHDMQEHGGSYRLNCDSHGAAPSEGQLSARSNKSSTCFFSSAPAFNLPRSALPTRSTSSKDYSWPWDNEDESFAGGGLLLAAGGGRGPGARGSTRELRGGHTGPALGACSQLSARSSAAHGKSASTSSFLSMIHQDASTGQRRKIRVARTTRRRTSFFVVPQALKGVLGMQSLNKIEDNQMRVWLWNQYQQIRSNDQRAMDSNAFLNTGSPDGPPEEFAMSAEHWSEEAQSRIKKAAIAMQFAVAKASQAVTLAQNATLDAVDAGNQCLCQDSNHAAPIETLQDLHAEVDMLRRKNDRLVKIYKEPYEEMVQRVADMDNDLADAKKKGFVSKVRSAVGETATAAKGAVTSAASSAKDLVSKIIPGGTASNNAAVMA
ncbi:unnamed protein product [Amoebophrya sp. A120]|nr:unnamed protein product [Amoebophrya sp. A120]|eukprot:GSA120T00021804001.1